MTNTGKGKISTIWANENKNINKLLIKSNLTFAKVHEPSRYFGKVKGYGSTENKINSVNLNGNCSKESKKDGEIEEVVVSSLRFFSFLWHKKIDALKEF